MVKSGRTHLMDATPVTLGQEFGGYAAQIRYGIERVKSTLPRVAELPLGGTAVGTGINTPAGFAASVISIIAEKTGLPLTEARDHFEAQGARDGLVEASGALRTIAVSLNKIANDLRWMGSGPRAGLGEIALPDLQPGSSIMPGKVNPVLCEATTMVCAQVIGNDAAVAFAGASGNFELNVMLPVMARNLLESIRLLANVSRLLADRCVDGIVANVEHCRTLAESSPSIVTPLNRYIGYENAAAVAKTGPQGGQDHPRGRDREGLRHRRISHRGAARRRPRRPVDDPRAGLAAARRLQAGAGVPGFRSRIRGGARSCTHDCWEQRQQVGARAGSLGRASGEDLTQYQPWARLKPQASHGLP